MEASYADGRWALFFVCDPINNDLLFPWHIYHDDVIKWKHFPRYWPFVQGIHRSPVNSPHKGQWHGALIFSLICVWINDWVNNRRDGDLRRYRAHYHVIVMCPTNDTYHINFTSYAINYTSYAKNTCDLVAYWSMTKLLNCGNIVVHVSVVSLKIIDWDTDIRWHVALSSYM